MNPLRIIGAALVFIGVAIAAPSPLYPLSSLRGSLGRPEPGDDSRSINTLPQVEPLLDVIEARFERCLQEADSQVNRLSANTTPFNGQRAVLQRCNNAYHAAMADARRMPPLAASDTPSTPPGRDAGNGAQIYSSKPSEKHKPARNRKPSENHKPTGNRKPADNRRSSGAGDANTVLVASNGFVLGSERPAVGEFAARRGPYKPFALAQVIPPAPAVGGCVTMVVDQYIVKEQKEIAGPEEQQQLSCVGECGLTKEWTYSVGVTVTVGGSIDVSKVAGAGLNTEVSTTTTKGTGDGLQVQCDGPWVCNILLTPKLLEVSGDKQGYNTCTNKKSGEPEPYTVRFPITRNGTPKATAAVCACKNYPHWADPGAPKPCPKDC